MKPHHVLDLISGVLLVGVLCLAFFALGNISETLSKTALLWIAIIALGITPGLMIAYPALRAMMQRVVLSNRLTLQIGTGLLLLIGSIAAIVTNFDTIHRRIVGPTVTEETVSRTCSTFNRLTPSYVDKHWPNSWRLCGPQSREVKNR